MGKNTGHGWRRGAVRRREQVYNPVTKRWVKVDTKTGQFMDVKSDSGKFKGVRAQDAGK